MQLLYLFKSYPTAQSTALPELSRHHVKARNVSRKGGEWKVNRQRKVSHWSWDHRQVDGWSMSTRREWGPTGNGNGIHTGIIVMLFLLLNAYKAFCHRNEASRTRTMQLITAKGKIRWVGCRMRFQRLGRMQRWCYRKRLLKILNTCIYNNYVMKSTRLSLLLQNYMHTTMTERGYQWSESWPAVTNRQALWWRSRNVHLEVEKGSAGKLAKLETQFK